MDIQCHIRILRYVVLSAVRKAAYEASSLIRSTWRCVVRLPIEAAFRSRREEANMFTPNGIPNRNDISEFERKIGFPLPVLSAVRKAASALRSNSKWQSSPHTSLPFPVCCPLSAKPSLHPATAQIGSPRPAQTCHFQPAGRKDIARAPAGWRLFRNLQRSGRA